MKSHLLFSAIRGATCCLFALSTTGDSPLNNPLPPLLKGKGARGLLPDDPLGTLLSGHPRLIILDKRIEAVKTLIAENTEAKGLYEKIQKNAERILSEPLVEYKIPDGLRLLGESRRCLHRIYTLATVYRFDGKEQYKERAVKELQAAASFPDWNPRHFLDTAEMTHAFAIGYDWLYGSLSDEEKNMIRGAIIEKGLKPALEVYEGRGWWAKSYHNWNQVCNGGIGIGALAIADEEPELSKKILRYANDSLKLPMSRFDPDGGWDEGPGYWNYATSYNVFILAALETSLGTDFGLADMPGFSETGMFPIYITGPLMKTFNYADGGEGMLRGPQMFWLAGRFDKHVYAWYERQVASPHPLDLLWFNPQGISPKAESMPLDKWFRNIDVVTFRSNWDDPKGMFVGFKGGDNRANHSHLDLGTYVLDALGHRWAVDLGADNYNMPGYFGNQRWNYYRLRTEGHNTITLNGENQDQSAKAPIIKFESSEDKALATADLKAAYPGAKKYLRTISLINRREIIITDDIEVAEPVEVTWHLHTPANVEISGRTAVLTQNEDKLRMEVLEPENAILEVHEVQIPPPQNPIQGIWKITVRPEREIKSTRIVVRFI
jgi:hypothetical protein